MGKLICPNCGSEVKLPEHSDLVSGITFSKESYGTHYLEMENKKENKTMTKNEERLATLKANGVDISKYFNIQLPNGSEVIMTMENGAPVPATLPNDTDEIRNQIIEDGYVRNTKLHRRFVMAQMFRMLNYPHSKYDTDGYTNAIYHLGFKYQFEMMLEELRVQMKLYDRDTDSYHDRNSFFNYVVAKDLVTDYAKALQKELDKLPRKNCKGLPYITFHGKNIFVDDINKKIMNQANRMSRKYRADMNPYTLYECFRRDYEFIKRNKISNNTRMSNYWIDAYKGAGAYYTLRNMVQFHNCFIEDYVTNKRYYGVDAIHYLESKVDEYAGEGWRFLAMLRKCISDNHFSFPNNNN